MFNKCYFEVGSKKVSWIESTLEQAGKTIEMSFTSKNDIKISNYTLNFNGPENGQNYSLHL